MGIGQTIQKTAQAEPNKPAIVYENTIISYKQFYDTVNRLRMQLQRLISNGKQPKIALCLGNEPAFLEVFSATVTLGGVAMPLDPKWSERETTEVLAKTKPEAIITGQHIQKAAHEAGFQQQVTHGMLLMALSTNQISPFLGKTWRIHKHTMKFVAPFM